MAGYSQTEVAKIFGISPQSYSKKERGITPFTDWEKVIFLKLIQNIAPEEDISSIFFDQLKTKLDEIMEGDEKNEK